MPIKRSSYQASKSLEEFYTSFAEHQNEIFAKGAIQMIEFIKAINDTFVETQLWAHTSHSRLGIQAKDDEFLTNVIYVSNIGIDEFYFEFKLPKSKEPWENAWVKGKANSIEEAIKFLLISMEETEEWKDNLELLKLAKEWK